MIPILLLHTKIYPRDYTLPEEMDIFRKLNDYGESWIRPMEGLFSTIPRGSCSRFRYPNTIIVSASESA